MMNDKMKKHLREFGLSDLIAIFGVFLLIFGRAPEDWELTLFICGPIVAFDGLFMIMGIRMDHLLERIQTLENIVHQSTFINNNEDSNTSGKGGDNHGSEKEIHQEELEEELR